MAEETEISSSSTRTASKRSILVHPKEIAVYIQKSSVQFDDIIYFLTNVEPARFRVPKPTNFLLSDDAWAALQLRVDHVARNILDPHRYYAASTCVAILIVIVFSAIRPHYDRQRIHAMVNEEDKTPDDDEMYDDYIQDDLYEKNHSMDDVVAAELTYLNAAAQESMWMWRMGLTISLVVLFGSVIFIAVLMERRNVTIDEQIRKAIEEIRPRVEAEGIAVEYRTRTSQPGILTFIGKYVRPTRVVVFASLPGSSPTPLEGEVRKAKNPFFSDVYQRRYFPPRSANDISTTIATSTYSII